MLVGLFGFMAFMAFFVRILSPGRASLGRHVPVENRQFCLGCREGYSVMLFVLMFNPPFTSGQPRNNLFGYVVFSFVLPVMTVCARHPAPASGAQEDHAESSVYPFTDAGRGALPGRRFR